MTETVTTEARIAAAYQRGDTIQEIADAEGLGYQQVRGALIRQEVQLRPRGRRAAKGGAR